MKQALISPNEQAYTGTWVLNPPGSKFQYRWNPVAIDNSQRVAEVLPVGQSFPVASPMYWKDCADDVVADQWYLDTSNDQIVLIPSPPPYPGN